MHSQTHQSKAVKFLSVVANVHRVGNRQQITAGVCGKACLKGTAACHFLDIKKKDLWNRKNKHLSFFRVLTDRKSPGNLFFILSVMQAKCAMSKYK